MSLLDIIIVLLVVGWLLGFSTLRGAVGGVIHLLLVIAVVLLLIRLLT